MWICLSGIACIFILYKIILYCVPPPDIPETVTVSGQLVKKEYKNDNLVLYLKKTKITSTSDSNSADKSKGFICYIKSGKEALTLYPAGSQIVLRGRAEKIRNATNPGEFDAAKYYAARGYYYSLSNGEVLSVRGGNRIAESLYRMRRRGTDIFESMYGEEYGGILSAMLLGEKNEIDEESKELYSMAGISHILAISGLHISLIGAFVYVLLSLTPVRSKAALFLTILFLVLYAFMVGFAPSVFRAVFMFAYRMAAKELKKAYDPPTALVLSAFLTCLFFPGLLTDSSYQLTYLAVAGILLVYPCFTPVVGKKTAFDGLFSGIGIFASTLPVVLCSFHRISFAGLILNFFILPAMPVLFVSAFASLFLSFWWMRGAMLFVTIGKSILYTFEFLSEKVLRFPGSVIAVKNPGTARCLVYAIMLLLASMAALYFKRKCLLKYYELVNEKAEEEERYIGNGGENGKVRIKTAKQKSGLKDGIVKWWKGINNKTLYKITYIYRLGFTAVLVLLFLFITGSPKDFTLTMLDVGQGDGIFLRTGSGDVYMIDGGSTSKNRVGERILIPYLTFEGEKCVDVWFLTHNDADHVNGFKEVLEDDGIEIKKLALPLTLKEEFVTLAKEAKDRGTEVIYLNAGDRISGGGRKSYEFVILSPDSTESYADSNAASFAIFYQEGDFSAVFMGDSETQAEDAALRFLKRYGDGCLEVLKCAHHGSANRTNTEFFLTEARPEISVISCGKNNRYGHPHKETMEILNSIGTKIQRTDLQGAVMIHKNSSRPLKKEGLKNRRYWMVPVRMRFFHVFHVVFCLITEENVVK